MHDVDVFAHIVAKAAKTYVESTRPHAHDASIPEPLDHVTTDYQKLKNSVQRLLKNKMIEFPAATRQGGPRWCSGRTRCGGWEKWWRCNSGNLPHFVFVLRALLTNAPNSCPPERLFSMFNPLFSDILSLGINIDSIPEPMGTCVEWKWFRYRNPWEINSFLAFALSRVVGRG
jgi:hypothetical protein